MEIEIRCSSLSKRRSDWSFCLSASIRGREKEEMNTYYDEAVGNWTDFDESMEDALADLGSDVAQGLMSPEEAISLVAQVARASNRE